MLDLCRITILLAYLLLEALLSRRGRSSVSCDATGGLGTTTGLVWAGRIASIPCTSSAGGIDIQDTGVSSANGGAADGLSTTANCLIGNGRITSTHCTSSAESIHFADMGGSVISSFPPSSASPLFPLN